MTIETFRRVSCDGQCGATAAATDNTNDIPSTWATLIVAYESTRHLCPRCYAIIKCVLWNQEIRAHVIKSVPDLPPKQSE